jgi:hypothetical protein
VGAARVGGLSGRSSFPRLPITSVAKPSPFFRLSHTDLATILGAFQVSYAITWLLGGIFPDAVGSRLGLALAVMPGLRRYCVITLPAA